jgi:hypothetical protein
VRVTGLKAAGFTSALMMLSAGGSAIQPESNLVYNGSFENLEGSQPAGWIAAGSPEVRQILSLDRGRDGGRSGKLVCAEFIRTGSSSHAMLAQLGKVKVKEGTFYRFSAWLRAEGIRGRQVSVALKDTKTWDSVGLEVPLKLTREWKRHEVLFKASRDLGESSRLQFWYAESGTLWIDEVEIVPAEKLKMAFTGAIEPTGSRNLVPNAGFEAGTDGWTSLGEQCGWGNLPSLFGRIVTGQAVDGERCLMIELGPGKTSVTWFDYFAPRRIEQKAPLAANVGWIAVKPGGKYTLSARMRADRTPVPAALLVRQCDPGGWPQDETAQVALDREWRRYTLTFDARRSYVFVAVGPDLRKDAQDTATVFLDSIQLEEGREAGPFVFREPVEIGFETGKFGNVFEPGEKAGFKVTGSNSGPREARIRLSAGIEDYFGRTSPAPVLSLDIPAGKTASLFWPLPLHGLGTSRARIAWESEGRKHASDIRLAVIEPYRETDSPFGVNHAPVTVELCRALLRAGVTWARDWTLKWSEVEPEQGKFDFKAADDQIGRQLNAGFRTLCLLPPFPSANWASSAPADLDITGYPGIRLKMAYAPKDPSLLARFIERTVGRYKDRMRVWEFLNEPVYTDYALPGEGQRRPGAAYTVKDYVGLLRTAGSAMKRADPDCRVIGGMGGWPDQLVDEFIGEGGLEALDILNLHIYPSKAPPESFIEPMAKLNGMMKKRGTVRPIWVTEYSYYGADDLPWTPFNAVSDNDWAGARLLDSEKECAEYSVRFALVMLGAGVEKIFYHSGANAEANAAGLECCLLGAGGVPRKVYAAQSALANLLGSAPRFAGRLTAPEGSEGLYGYAFQCGGRAVLAAWADDAGDGWTIAAPDGVEAFDILGNPAGRGPWALSGSPVYLVSTKLTAESLVNGGKFKRR